MSIIKTIKNREKDHYLSFHTPGHKGRALCYSPVLTDDITELADTDDLHEPSGIIKESMNLASSLYGSKTSFFSTNGSTASNMAAIHALTDINDSILICGNAHVSVEHIVKLKELNTIRVESKPLMEDFNEIRSGVDPDDVEKALDAHRDIKAVFITSPNYEGILSDIKEIALRVHKYKIPLIVDEAHGAHLALSPVFPPSALQLGADIVINSLHKTLPALTGTSLLHISRSFETDTEAVAKSLSIFLSTSPSYLMLASIDSCLALLEKRSKTLFETLDQNLKELYHSLRALKHLRILDPDKNAGILKDPSRLVILSESEHLSGHRLYEILRTHYKIEMEKSADRYLIGITTIADRLEDYQALSFALTEIDRNMEEGFFYDQDI